MAEYIDEDTGRRVVVRSRRPSIMMSILFVFAVGLIVWLMIPANHGWISFNAPQPVATTPLAKAPPGSVSGAANSVETTGAQPTRSNTPSTP